MCRQALQSSLAAMIAAVGAGATSEGAPGHMSVCRRQVTCLPAPGQLITMAYIPVPCATLSWFPSWHHGCKLVCACFIDIKPVLQATLWHNPHLLKHKLSTVDCCCWIDLSSICICPLFSTSGGIFLSKAAVLFALVQYIASSRVCRIGRTSQSLSALLLVACAEELAIASSAARVIHTNASSRTCFAQTSPSFTHLSGQQSIHACQGSVIGFTIASGLHGQLV